MQNFRGFKIFFDKGCVTVIDPTKTHKRAIFTGSCTRTLQLQAVAHILKCTKKSGKF